MARRTQRVRAPVDAIRDETERQGLSRRVRPRTLPKESDTRRLVCLLHEHEGRSAMIPQPERVEVASGAVVGIYEFGDPTGDAVFALHGVPACGAGFAFA